MIDGFTLPLVVVTALGCGLMGGAFFAFSSFVMSGLKRLPTEQGIAAMQSINITAVTPAFMTALFATAAGCIAVVIAALVDWRQSVSIYLLVGAGLYLAGVIVMTGVYHVPRNNALAAADPASDEGAELWARYPREWTGWNHVRTFTALAAAAAFTIAIRVG